LSKVSLFFYFLLPEWWSFYKRHQSIVIISEQCQTAESLGNLSNPSVNRWGRNLFWRYLGYVDKKYPLFIQLTKAIDHLIYLYLLFGLLSYNDKFTSAYWYENHTDIQSVTEYTKIFKYFRRTLYIDRIFQIDNYYNLRVSLKHAYTSRIQIFKYQEWFIVNFYYFQPLSFRKSLWRRKVNTYGFAFGKYSSLVSAKRFKFFYTLVAHDTQTSNNLFYF